MGLFDGVINCLYQIDSRIDYGASDVEGLFKLFRINDGVGG
ncbi:hypothetical protein JCM19240_2013 [Vibrio maritimus]|uniref:Uncharacterized protein n=1 Tax=Vibrio maritimus TaxID=990268 RepID=A0A090TQ90_9VIBR|nr:hypothetical protein JCM19240_2013 [Vibrio maritimus]